MTANSVKLRRQRWRLFQEQAGLCYYCKKPMKWIATDKGEKMVPDGATTEHLDDRFSPERGQHQGELRHAVVHWQCNNDRAAQRDREQPIEVRQERSKQPVTGSKYDVRKLNPEHFKRLKDGKN